MKRERRISTLLSRSDVQRAYRLFLGRDPENDAVIDGFRKLSSLEELRTSFLACEEFQNISAPYRDGYHRRLLLDDGMRVQTEMNSKERAQMMRHLVQTWEMLGKAEPYWSVLSTDEFRTSNFADHAEDFFRSGTDDIANMGAALRRAGRDRTGGRCLEFGCGVGRMTIPLSQRFDEVIGFDISAPHLRLAKERIDLQGAGERISLKRAENNIDLRSLGTFDFIFSVIVLQHNPPPLIREILEQFCDVLRPEGLAYFQVPTYRRGYVFELSRYLQSDETGIEMHAIPQNVVFSVLENRGCQLLEVREDGLVGIPDFISNAFLIQKR
jgi:SAM-dependent methyltransferase